MKFFSTDGNPLVDLYHWGHFCWRQFGEGFFGGGSMFNCILFCADIVFGSILCILCMICVGSIVANDRSTKDK